MTPNDFIAKWHASPKDERRDSQPHFLDLCRLLEIEDPATADPNHNWFTFERGASKTSGGSGWADVWRKSCFGWEYKGVGKDLDAAYRQLLNYSVALDNPPLLIVSDMARFRIHTNWTNTVQEKHEFGLDDLADAKWRDLLRNCFLAPEELKPKKTRQALTEEAASKFADLAQRLRSRGHDAQAVAHFVNRLVFCMFAEDVRLLPNHMFRRMIEACQAAPEDFEPHARTLFGAMRSGGMVGFERVSWFNGGLFDDDVAFPLSRDDLRDVLAAAKLDWSDVDPSIMGTLFERGLDPDKRSQLGAHYTDRDKIMQIVNPVIVEPLTAEWTESKARIEDALAREKAAKSRAAATRAHNEARRIFAEFGERLRGFRVLDPACGSGNFLYLSLLALKDLENLVNLEGESLGFGKGFPSVGPEAVKGIELNPYAAELARVSVWIGEIQWMRRNGFEAAKNPILKPLQTIECRDAVLNEDGTRAEWPEADVVVGNPPFLGDKKMRSSLGAEYTNALRVAYSGRLAGRSDLVTYWFSQALNYLKLNRISRAGFVSTNSIRQKSNRGILDQISEFGEIFDAWSDEPWVVDGAAVRVSLICFGKKGEARQLFVDGKLAAEISSELIDGGSGLGLNVKLISTIQSNGAVAFQGIKRVGRFEIERSKAIKWIELPLNPNGRPNSDVLRPWASGFDIVRRPQDMWIVDFGWDTPFDAACLYEAPFSYLDAVVRPERHGKREARANEMWWIYYWPRPELRKSLRKITRFIARPSVSKYHIVRWLESTILPDGALVVICREDDCSFGLIQSKIHEVWSLARGSTLEDRPSYTPSTTFETFPFPEGLTPDIPAADYADDPRAQKIAAAAARLNELRENWLNPPDLVRREPEVVPGYPDRILPVDDAAAAVLKKRTLTNLYNARPAWLDHAHATLDEAVAEAYGWGDDWRAGLLTEDEILARLFRLNQERAAAQ